MVKTHRVLQLIIGLGVGGAEIALLRSSRELKKRGHDIRVLSIKRMNNLESEFMKENIPVLYLADLLKSRKAFSALRAWHPEILLAWMPAAHLLSVALKKALNAEHLIWNVRQSLNRMEQIPLKTRMLIRTSAQFSQNADAIIYNSVQGEVDHKAVGYSTQFNQVITNGFLIPNLSNGNDIVTIKQKLRLSNAPVITFVGRNHPDKGAKYFVQAALEFLKGHDAEFLIAGSGFEQMKISITHAKLHFLGNLNEAELGEVYSISDIFTSSSISEGFSNAIGEAMSYANYPVVTNVGDSAKIVGEFGAVVEPGNPEQICAAWLNFLSLSDERKKNLRQCARQRIETEYSLANVIKKYEDLFNAVDEF